MSQRMKNWILVPAPKINYEQQHKTPQRWSLGVFWIFAFLATWLACYKANFLFITERSNEVANTSIICLSFLPGLIGLVCFSSGRATLSSPGLKDDCICHPYNKVWGGGGKKGSASGGFFQSDLQSRQFHSHCNNSNIQKQSAVQTLKWKQSLSFYPAPHKTLWFTEQHVVGINTLPYGKGWLALKMGF